MRGSVCTCKSIKMCKISCMRRMAFTAPATLKRNHEASKSLNIWGCLINKSARKSCAQSELRRFIRGSMK